MRRGWLIVGIACGLGACADATGPIVLTASHQWPGGIDDPRDEVPQSLSASFCYACSPVSRRGYPTR